MIAYRHTDPRFPFLREDSSQSAGRWNSTGELTHYFCDTPDGAWAEFLRHEEIYDPQDLETVRRAIWAVDIGKIPSHRPCLPQTTLIGGRNTWSACQQAAQRLRKLADGVAAPSAALKPGAAHGWRVDGGLQPGPNRDGEVYALFGRRPDLIGWATTVDGRPSPDLLRRIRHF
ncbi:MAG: RES domain-containing protein [Rhodobacteraceae bacterium]|nr:RES domain-containing protein [Paracoccaceae bacterium]